MEVAIAYAGVLNCCCFITVDFATAASKDRFNTFKLSHHKKNDIGQKIPKYCRLGVFITFIPLQNHHYVAVPLNILVEIHILRTLP